MERMKKKEIVFFRFLSKGRIVDGAVGVFFYIYIIIVVVVCDCSPFLVYRLSSLEIVSSFGITGV